MNDKDIRSQYMLRPLPRRKAQSRKKHPVTTTWQPPKARDKVCPTCNGTGRV